MFCARAENVQRKLDEAEWHKKHVQAENDWLKSQLSTLGPITDKKLPAFEKALSAASADSDFPGPEPHADSGRGVGDGGEGVAASDERQGVGAGSVYRERDSLNQHSAPEIGISSLTVALSKMTSFVYGDGATPASEQVAAAATLGAALPGDGGRGAGAFSSGVLEEPVLQVRHASLQVRS